MNAERLASWLAESVPSVLRQEFPNRADLCVLATRTGYDVCRYFGVTAKPVVVRTIAFNEQWRLFAEAHPELLEDFNNDAWDQAKADGAWAVAIDETDRNEQGRFAGHLVLHLPTIGQILDLSLRQFARPEHSMDFPDSAAFNVGPRFLAGETCIYGTDDGAMIAYRRRDDVTDYRSGPDWRLHNPLSGPLIRKAKVELAEVAA